MVFGFLFYQENLQQNSLTSIVALNCVKIPHMVPCPKEGYYASGKTPDLETINCWLQ